MPGMAKECELIGLGRSYKNLNRTLFPRRAVYLDAIAENPELRLGILYFLWRKSAFLGKNRALKKVRK